MPPNVSTVRKFLVDTDYPIDPLVVLGTVDFTVTANTTGTVNIPHSFGFPPLMGGSWSLTSDYEVLYGLNAGPIASNPTVSPFTSTVRLRSTNSDITIVVDNFTAGTLHYYNRLWGFQPPDSTVAVGGTSPVGSGFQINSDDNYLKRHLSNYYDAAAGSGSPVSVSIPHTLGTDAQIATWKRDSGVVIPLTVHDAGDIQIEDVVAWIDSTNVHLEFSGLHPALRVYYKVYIDG